MNAIDSTARTIRTRVVDGVWTVRFPQLASLVLEVVEGPLSGDTDSELPPDARLTVVPHGDDLLVEATVRVHRPTHLAAVVKIPLLHAFGVVMYEAGVVQQLAGAGKACWVASNSPLVAAYSMSRDAGSVAITPADGRVRTIAGWDAADDRFTVSAVLAGELAGKVNEVVDGVWDSALSLNPIAVNTGTVLTLRLLVSPSDLPYPSLGVDAVDLPDPKDAAAHRTSLWGTQIGTLGTLELGGSCYPTLSDPVRTYGTLHTFFDPDACSVVTALAYSGVEYLQQQARHIVERSVTGIRLDGLVPHHFDRDKPKYVAMSGSPQPGPNLFLLEAAINVACATGDIAWLETVWDRGLRSAVEWFLGQFDPERGLFCVTGALWVDVFRRAGYTLDTNAMAVRTLGRVAEVATTFGDPLAERLLETQAAVVAAMPSLWADSGDHFVTSRTEDWSGFEDFLDTENYLAIATGAATPEQAKRIVGLFDASPLTHPRDRGTYVSLIRYEEEDCYLGNTGDSDIAMARHWWADMLARRAMRDRDGFWRHFEPVRSDLLELVWMTERYSQEGKMVRASSYHEYPGVIDQLIREGVHGLSISLGSVEISPMAHDSFAARWGNVSLSYSRDAVQLQLADSLERRITVSGMHAGAQYRAGDELLVADEAGVLESRMSGTFSAHLIEARA